MSTDEFRKEFFVNRNNALIKSGDLLDISISTNDIMANLRKACGGDQSYISGANHCDFHAVPSITKCDKSLWRRQHRAVLIPPKPMLNVSAFLMG